MPKSSEFPVLEAILAGRTAFARLRIGVRKSTRIRGIANVKW